MSTLAEKARDEAERAEVENPDDEEQAEEEETQPEPAQPPEGPSEEQQMKALEREVARFEKALCKMLGVEPPLEPVPFDGAIGFLFPGALDYKTHPFFKRCPTCNGRGDVLTGAVKQGEETAPCPDPNCRGRGYWKKAQEQAEAASILPPTAPKPENEWEQPSWMGDPTVGR